MTINSNESKESDKSLLFQNQESSGIDRNWHFLLAVLAFLTPFIVMPFLGLYWVAGVAILIFAVWASVMPTTCMNGGLIYSFITTMLLINAIFLVIFAILRLLSLV
jgi:hypothetical protein